MLLIIVTSWLFLKKVIECVFRVASLAFLAWVCGAEMCVSEKGTKAKQKKVKERHDISLVGEDAVAA